MTIPFVKMTGGGNDFILLDGRTSPLPSGIDTYAEGLCRRRYGIGADGLILLFPSTSADCRMLYFNADGSKAALCGNGTRCVAWYISKGGKNPGGSVVTLECESQTYRASVTHDTVQLNLPGTYTPEKTLKIPVATYQLTLVTIAVGVPHAVSLHSDISSLDVPGLGREIQRRNDFFPHSTNIDFVQIHTGKKPVLILRTYERGIEDETLCCGTGAVASALVAHEVRGITSPVEVRTAGGESLEIGFTRRQNLYRDVWLRGRVEKVFEGKFNGGGIDVEGRQ
jgi:diaminopimelate epimerase